MKHALPALRRWLRRLLFRLSWRLARAEGEGEMDFVYPGDCPDCGGTGFVECRPCGGSGWRHRAAD